MAVERTGTAVTINTASDSSSQSITVPSDATLAVVFFGGYISAGTHVAGDVTLTLGGTTMTNVAHNPGTASGVNGIWIRQLLYPSTGSQTFAWSTGRTFNYGILITIVFYKGVDTVNPIKSSSAIDTSGGTPTPITGLTYATGDMMVGGIENDDSPTVTTDSQTQINVSAQGAKGGGYLGVAEKASVGAFYVGSVNYGALGAIVIAQASETGTLNQHSFRFFNDDGSESAATAKAAINTNINLSANDVARIRFLIDATNDPTTRKFQLEYRKKPSGCSFGPWAEVT